MRTRVGGVLMVAIASLFAWRLYKRMKLSFVCSTIGSGLESFMDQMQKVFGPGKHINKQMLNGCTIYSLRCWALDASTHTKR